MSNPGDMVNKVGEMAGKTVETVKPLVENLKDIPHPEGGEAMKLGELKNYIEIKSIDFPKQTAESYAKVNIDGLSPDEVIKVKSDSGVENKLAAADQKVSAAVEAAKKKLEELTAARDLSTDTRGYARRDAEVEAAKADLKLAEDAAKTSETAPSENKEKSKIEDFADDMATFGHNSAIPEDSKPAEVKQEASTEEPKFDMGIENVEKKPKGESLFKKITGAINSRFSKINDGVNAIDEKYIQPLNSKLLNAPSAITEFVKDNVAVEEFRAWKMATGESFVDFAKRKGEQVKKYIDKEIEMQRMMAQISREADAAMIKGVKDGITSLFKGLKNFSAGCLDYYKNAQREAKIKYEVGMNQRKMDVYMKKMYASAEKSKTEMEKAKKMETKKRQLNAINIKLVAPQAAPTETKQEVVATVAETTPVDAPAAPIENTVPVAEPIAEVQPTEAAAEKPVPTESVPVAEPVAQNEAAAPQPKVEQNPNVANLEGVMDELDYVRKMENELIETKATADPAIYKSEYERIDEFKQEIINKGLAQLRAKQNQIFLKKVRDEIGIDEFKRIEADFYKASDELKKKIERIDKN